jgi:hypothetical protein
VARTEDTTSKSYLSSVVLLVVTGILYLATCYLVTTRSLLFVVPGKWSPSRCSATDVWLHYSGFQPSRHNIMTHLRLSLPCGLFPSGFPTNILHAFLFIPKGNVQNLTDVEDVSFIWLKHDMCGGGAGRGSVPVPRMTRLSHDTRYKGFSNTNCMLKKHLS